MTLNLMNIIMLLIGLKKLYKLFLLGIIILIVNHLFYTIGGILMDKLILNLKEASQYLNISQSKMSEMALKKEIRSYKIGKCRRFHINDLNKFLESHAEGGDDDA